MSNTPTDADGCLETLREAMALMRQVQPDAAYTKMLIQVVDLFLRIGREDDAQRAWELAWETANTTPEPSVSYILLARRCLLSGDVPTALETVSRIREPFQADILRSIAKVQAQQGKIDLALDTAGQIGEPGGRRYAYTKIAKIVAKRGNVELSEQILIKAGLSAQDPLFEQVISQNQQKKASKLADYGRFEAALETALSIPNALVRDETLMEIAFYQTRWHEHTLARATLDLIQNQGNFLRGAIEMSNVLTLQDNDGRPILLEAIPVARGLEDKLMQTEHLREISNCLVEIGDIIMGRAILEEASTAAQQIEDDKKRLDLLTIIAESMAEIGDLEGRDRSVEAALPIALAQTAVWDREYGSKKAAEMLWRVGREAESRAILAKVADRLALLSDPETREKAYVSLACHQACLGDIVSAGQTLEQIFSLDQRVFVLLTVAQSQAEASDSERCRKTIDIALRILAACEDMGFKLSMLIDFAKLQAGREAKDADDTD